MFLEKTKELFKNKDDLLKYAGYGALIFMVLVIIIITAAISNTHEKEYIIDGPSGEKIITKNTGAAIDKTVIFPGMETISQKGLDQEVLVSVRSIMESYFKYQYPQFERVSVRKNDGINVEDNTYSFRLESNTGKVFDGSIKYVSKSDWSVKLSDKETILLDYSSANQPVALRDISKISQNELPYSTKTSDGRNVTLLKRAYDNKYEISVNSCGNKQIKEEAETIVKEWLKSKQYNPDTLKYEMPDYCDGEAR